MGHGAPCCCWRSCRVDCGGTGGCEAAGAAGWIAPLPRLPRTVSDKLGSGVRAARQAVTAATAVMLPPDARPLPFDLDDATSTDDAGVAGEAASARLAAGGGGAPRGRAACCAAKAARAAAVSSSVRAQWAECHISIYCMAMVNV